MIPPLLALFAWPPVVIVLFRKYSVTVALLITIIGGYLFLPTRVSLDLPLLPALDKHTVPALTALFLVMLTTPKETIPNPGRGPLSQSHIANGLIFLAMVSPFLTVMTNQDPLSFGPRRIQPMQIYDAFSFTLSAMMLLLPMMLGYRYLGSERQNKMVLLALVVAGLIYAVPTLWEARMSPQLNRGLYGFFPHSWLQHVRGGAYRPIVFLDHGLWLSLFMALTALAAFGAHKAKLTKDPKRVLYAAIFLFVVLLITRSLGAAVITMVLIPVILFLKPRTQLIVAACVAGIVLTYPMLRSAGLVPTQAILTQVSAFSPERAASFEVRLRNEDQLLAKAQRRPAFGWGGYGRNRIYDRRGRDITVTDGYWIIALSSGGWLRYIATFGLLTGPLILLAVRARRLNVGPSTAALGIVLSANLIDLIPNATGTPITWLLAGALWGRLAYATADDDEAVADPGAAKSRTTPYARPHAAPPLASGEVLARASNAPPKPMARGRTSAYSRQTQPKFRDS